MTREPVYTAAIDWYGHGGLASGIAGWSYRPGDLDTFELSSEQTIRGGESIKATASMSGNGVLARMIFGPAGVDVTFSVWVYQVGGGGGTNVSLTAYRSTGGTEGDDETFLKDQWVQLSVTMSQTEDTQYVLFVSHNASIPPNHYFLGWSEARTADDDISCRVLATRQVPDIVYGRDNARDFAEVRSGEIELELLNDDGFLTPDSGLVGYSSYIGPGLQVVIGAEFEDSSITLYNGYTDELKLNAAPDQESITFSCVDLLAKLHETQVHTELYESIRTGDAVKAVCESAGLRKTIQSDIFDTNFYELLDFDTDTGGTTLVWWSATDMAKQALDDILAAEGAPSIYTVGSSNQIIYRDRHHRVRLDYPTTPANTLVDCDDGSLSSNEFVISVQESNIDLGWKTFYNRVDHSGSTRAPAAELSDVWTDPEVTRSFSGRIEITADVEGFIDGQRPILGKRQKTIEVGLDDEVSFSEAVSPEVHDFVVESGTVTVEEYATSGTRVRLVLVAAGPARISGLKFRARAIAVEETQSSLDDQSSQTKFRKVKPYAYTSNAASPNDGEDVTKLILKMNSSPRPYVTIVVQNREERYTEMMLDTDISQEFAVVHQKWNVAGDSFAVEGMEHVAGELGKDHKLKLYAQKSTPKPYDRKYITFDANGLGFDEGGFAEFYNSPFVFGNSEFGEDAFGYNAKLDTPFILGTSTLDSSDEIWY